MKVEEGRKDQLVDSPKTLLAPLTSKHDLTLLPGTEGHGEIAETQWVVVLNNLAQKLTPINFNIWLQKQKAACYVVSVKSQLLRRPIFWVWSLK